MLLGVIVAICTVAGGAHGAEASTRKPGVARKDAGARKDLRPAAEVVGRVVDAFGHAVANATVVVTPARPDRTWNAPRTQSDASGRFRFIGLPPGDYVFVALHGEHAGGVSPVMPVERTLEVVLVVGNTVISA